MQFVSIDFETANQEPSSACAIGLSRFDEDGRQVDSWYSLIRPPVMYFDLVCVSVHGLHPADCRWMPTFDELYGEIRSFIGDDVLVAHNAPFDMGVLRATAQHYGIALPNWQYYCTLAISRRLLPQYRSHRLGHLVSEYLQEDYDAHVASSDAYECARLFSRMLSDMLYDKQSLDRFLSLKGIRYPRFLFPSA